MVCMLFMQPDSMTASNPLTPMDAGLFSNQLVFRSIPAVGFDALVIEAWVVPPPISELLFLVFVQHMGDGGLLPLARCIFFITEVISGVRIGCWGWCLGWGLGSFFGFLQFWWFLRLGACGALHSSANNGSQGIYRSSGGGLLCPPCY